MKKIISLATAFIILFSVCLSSSAGSYDNPPETVKINNQYGFRYTEYTDAEHRTVRIYSAADNTNVQNGTALCSLQSDSDYLRTKSILSSLGMGDDFIAELSDEQLNEYASSESIYASTEYIRTDMNGNQTTVSEEEALNASASVNPTAAPPTDDFVDDGGGDYPVYYDIMTDSYMKLTYVVSYRGNAKYNFSVDALWLTMPKYRLTDSLGCCAQGISIISGTKSGWISYDEARCVNTTYSTHSYKYNYTNNEVQFALNSGWQGAVITFDLPDNVSVSSTIYTTSSTYSNFKAHCEFDAYIANPDTELYFNTSATYDHTKIAVVGSHNVSLSVSGVGFAIGFSISDKQEKRTIFFDSPIHFSPN